jgi:hypothetical protein
MLCLLRNKTKVLVLARNAIGAAGLRGIVSCMQCSLSPPSPEHSSSSATLVSSSAVSRDVLCPFNLDLSWNPIDNKYAAQHFLHVQRNRSVAIH